MASFSDLSLSEAKHAASSRRSAWDRFKWLLACLGIFVAFFVLMNVGALVSYYLESDILASDLEIDFGYAWEIAASSEYASLRASIGGQLAILLVFLPFWLRVRRRAFCPLRRERRPRGVGKTTLSIAGIVVAGVGLQLFVGYVLGYLLQFLPNLAQEYDEVYTDAENQLSLVSMLTVVILAPVIEEISCRGLMFEFLMRAFDARWNPRTGAQGLMMPRTFVVVCAITAQALIFAVMHMNIVQGAYAFFMGLLFGFVYWRTGSLLYSMGLHLAINFSSYLVDVIGLLLDPLGYASCIAIGTLISLAGFGIFAYATGRQSLCFRKLPLRENNLA